MTGLKPVVRIVLVIGIEPITQTLSCPGFDEAERNSQLRLVALPIVPNYLSEPASPFRQIVRSYLPERPWRRSFDPVKERTTEYPTNGSSPLHTS